ncbi:MAG: epoxide hydrolase family protein [Pseudomonadota bacterium]
MKPLANTLALGAVATLALTSATPAQEITMEQATPFEIAIPDATITDLRQRINATRFPDQIEGSGHDYGMDTQYLRGVLEYWANDYDWRAEEARLNAFDHFHAEIDGLRVHFIHERSVKEDAIPLLLLHGWPSSFVQMLDIIPLLTDPERGQAFHVVVASLPGYGFSDIPTEPGMSVGRVAPLMNSLMVDVLGYDRYGIRSSDLGAGVASSMALSFPEAIIGSHTGGTNPFLPPQIPEDLTPAEERHIADAQAWNASEMAYLQLHASKPQTIGAALNDSPAGLAAWIGEKFWRWTDNNGLIEDAIDRDAFLTNLTVYWATETINPSMRLYYETFRDQGGWGTPDVPVGYLMPVNDLFPTPRSWVERQGPVSHWTESAVGGHFMEWEEPEVVADDLRAFFATIE